MNIPFTDKFFYDSLSELSSLESRETLEKDEVYKIHYIWVHEFKKYTVSSNVEDTSDIFNITEEEIVKKTKTFIEFMYERLMIGRENRQKEIKDKLNVFEFKKK